MSAKPVRIFVVDEDAVIARTIADILRLSGLSPVSFTNPLVALKAAMSDSPDLVISDITMSELSGIELAIRLKSMNLDCNILLVSGPRWPSCEPQCVKSRAQSVQESARISPLVYHILGY
jgi:DNA-binding NtrC family response regulator